MDESMMIILSPESEVGLASEDITTTNDTVLLEESNSQQKQQLVAEEERIGDSEDRKQQQHPTSITMTTTTKTAAVEVVPAKIERRRLKKLLKRSHRKLVTDQATINSKATTMTTSHHETTGIASLTEFYELQTLLQNHQQSESNHNSPSPIISIQWRGGKIRNQTEGVHHRDLLYYLISNVTKKLSKSKIPLGQVETEQRQQKLPEMIGENNNKRILSAEEENAEAVQDRSSSSSSSLEGSSIVAQIPSWASIHNPVMVNHVAIIEININDLTTNKHNNTNNNDDANYLLVAQEKINNQFRKIIEKHTTSSTTISASTNSTAATTSANNSSSSNGIGDKTHDATNNNSDYYSLLAADTRWYQGYTPKSIADVFMYSSNNSNNSNNSKGTAGRDGGSNRSNNKKLKKSSSAISGSTTGGNRTMTATETSTSAASCSSSTDPSSATSILLPSDVYNLLQQFIATTDQLDTECFPGLSNAENTKIETTKVGTVAAERNKNLPPVLQRGMIPSLDEAMSFIPNFQVGYDCIRSLNNDDDCGRKNDKRPMFVVASTEVIQAQNPDVINDELNDSPNSNQRNIYALDCEMVKTKFGSELARITLLQLEEVMVTSLDDGSTGAASVGSTINIKTKLIFDNLVKPVNVVYDYVTEYSGVTAAMLNSPNAVRLEQVQAALIATVQPNDIIIGHSLENDLLALRWIHNAIVDTSLMFRQQPNGNSNNGNNTTRQFKFSLRHLSAVLLKKRIQQSDQPHCSEVDAITALELAVRCAVEGPTFGISKCFPDNVNRLGQLTRSKLTKSVCVGPIGWLQQHVLNGHNGPNSVHALQCESIHAPNVKAVKAWLTRANNKATTRMAHLVWASFNVDTVNFDMSNKDVDQYDKFFSELFGSMSQSSLKRLPENTIVCIALQHGLQSATEISKMRHVRRKPQATIAWTDYDENRYKRAIEVSQKGQVFWIGPSNISSPM